MSKRNETSKAGPKTVAEAITLSSGPADAPDAPDATLQSLEQIIEAERAQLLQAHSVIKCVYEVLLYSDSENALHHADAANLAAQLIDGVADRLEPLNLRAKLAEMKRAIDESPAATRMQDDCVRDVARGSSWAVLRPTDRRH